MALVYCPIAESGVWAVRYASVRIQWLVVGDSVGILAGGAVRGQASASGAARSARHTAIVGGHPKASVRACRYALRSIQPEEVDHGADGLAA